MTQITGIISGLCFYTHSAGWRSRSSLTIFLPRTCQASDNSDMFAVLCMYVSTVLRVYVSRACVRACVRVSRVLYMSLFVFIFSLCMCVVVYVLLSRSHCFSVSPPSPITSLYMETSCISIYGNIVYQYIWKHLVSASSA
jgi:hypothetical protein